MPTPNALWVGIMAHNNAYGIPFLQTPWQNGNGGAEGWRADWPEPGRRSFQRLHPISNFTYEMVNDTREKSPRRAILGSWAWMPLLPPRPVKISLPISLVKSDWKLQPETPPPRLRPVRPPAFRTAVLVLPWRLQKGDSVCSALAVFNPIPCFSSTALQLRKDRVSIHRLAQGRCKGCS